MYIWASVHLDVLHVNRKLVSDRQTNTHTHTNTEITSSSASFYHSFLLLFPFFLLHQQRLHLFSSAPCSIKARHSWMIADLVCTIECTPNRSFVVSVSVQGSVIWRQTLGTRPVALCSWRACPMCDAHVFALVVSSSAVSVCLCVCAVVIVWHSVCLLHRHCQFDH